ncbi:hypothetical protein N7G274_002770 [Stereocaulon virgatum]|uniref:Lysine-specific metallo-endopeptidase domain-containing protein n=1 Tax=Stereocaulon virgatum TaxID=373712 RepID=A0ABR4AHR6_9LECA
MLQALLHGLLTLALAQATPTRIEPSPIAKRGDPSGPSQGPSASKPSHYPLGDSAECANEPLYLNFDTGKEGDVKRLEKLHHVFCNDFNFLTIAGSTATNDADRTIYERFFPESDKEDDYKAYVNDIWNKLFDFKAQTPSALVASFIIDNVDWKKDCGETPGADLSPGSEDLMEAAYTDFDDVDKLEKTHFCVTALENLDLATITCNTLDTYPSWQMESTGRVMLHEFTHYSTVGPNSLRKFYECLQNPYAMARYEGALWLGPFLRTAPKLGTEPERKASLM